MKAWLEDGDELAENEAVGIVRDMGYTANEAREIIERIDCGDTVQTKNLGICSVWRISLFRESLGLYPFPQSVRRFGFAQKVKKVKVL